jgi:hypothetical protein
MNTASLILGSQRPREGVVLPFIFIGTMVAFPQAPLHHFLSALVIVSDFTYLYQLRPSTHKVSEPCIEFVIWILDTLLGQSLILLFPLALFSGICGVAKVVVSSFCA